jgi:hypothetical protein
LKSLALGLLSSFCILVASSAGAAESPQQIFEKVASAYGAAAPAAIRETGSTTSEVRGRGTLLRQYKAPDRFRSEISYASGVEMRAMVGARIWKDGSPANSLLRGAIALQAARVALPWNILARQSAAIDLGTASNAEGKTVRAFEFPLEDQLKLIVEIDPETGYILRSRGILSSSGNTVEFATVYSNFRKENGRVRACKEEQFALGQNIGHTVIEKTEYPDNISDSVFMPPSPEIML